MRALSPWAPPGTEPPFASAPPPTWPDEEELAALLAELPGRPLLFGFDAEDQSLRLSLAGAQDKLPVLVAEGGIGITRGDPPSTHIVKTPAPDIDGMVANEAFCMALAREIGLDVAATKPVRVGDQEGLLVTRYDRVAEGEAVRRVHQEDLCQASIRSSRLRQ